MGGLDGFHSCTSIGGGVYRSVMNIWKKNQARAGQSWKVEEKVSDIPRKGISYTENWYDLTRIMYDLPRNLIWYNEKNVWFNENNVLFTKKIDII